MLADGQLARACSAKTEKYSSKIENHIKFLENILESYPVEEKPPHCSKPEEIVEAEKKVVSVKVVTGENGKPSKQYTFDPKTNELAVPKVSVLAGAKEVHDELLIEFEKDARKAANLKKPSTPAPEEKPEEEKGPKKLPSESQKNQIKAAKEAEITKRDHAGLVDRTKRLAELLKAEADRIERMQVKLKLLFEESNDFNFISVCRHRKWTAPRLRCATTCRATLNRNATALANTRCKVNTNQSATLWPQGAGFERRWKSIETSSSRESAMLCSKSRWTWC